MACCPYLYTIRILARKWSYPVLHALEHQRTFSQLKAELALVTSRVLSHELKQLTSEGLIQNHGGHYQLTQAGRSFVHAVRSMGRWGQKYGPCAQCDGKSCNGCTVYRDAITGVCACGAKSV